MEEVLANTIYCEDNEIRVDIRPKSFYNTDLGIEKNRIQDGSIIPILYNGLLSYI